MFINCSAGFQPQLIIVGAMVAVGVMVVVRGNGGGSAFYFSIIFRVVPILTSGMGFAST